jgi:ribonuclease VapC
MSIYVFDSSALIAFFNDEDGADNIEKILLQDNDHFISIINVFEICYDAAKRSGYDVGIQIFEEIKQLPIKIIFEIKTKCRGKSCLLQNKF